MDDFADSFPDIDADTLLQTMRDTGGEVRTFMDGETHCVVLELEGERFVGRGDTDRAAAFALVCSYGRAWREE